MAVKLDELYKALDEMREVYRFDYEKTRFELGHDMRTCDYTVACIITKDEATGTLVRLERRIG